jgi:signal transduction histidine kinase
MATGVTVRADLSDGQLRVEVADDGIGGADPSRGSGLRGLADRVAVVDGRLDIDSSRGKGTRLVCRIPVPSLEVESELVPTEARSDYLVTERRA